MPKTTWVNWADVPDAVKPLLQTYSRVYDALYHDGNLVRLMSDGPHPVVVIQHNGRINPTKIKALQDALGCLVEVKATAPGYYEVMIFGAERPSEAPTNGQWGYDGVPNGVRFRADRRDGM